MMKNYKQLLAFIALSVITLSQIWAQDIEFSFENAQNTNDGTNDYFEVDVMIKTINNTADFKLGSGQLYFTYNTAAFGDNVKANNAIETSQPNSEYICAQPIDLIDAIKIYGGFTVNDNTTSRVSWAFSQSFSSSTFAANNVTSTARKLVHLKFKYTNVNESPMVAFEDSDVFDDQFFTACGPDTGSSSESADCSNHPGIQITNDSFNSSGATLSTTNLLVAESTIKLYPNPVKDYVQILNHQNIKINKIEIYNVIGKKVKTFKNSTENLDVSKLSKGVYLVKIIADKGEVAKRIVKE